MAAERGAHVNIIVQPHVKSMDLSVQQFPSECWQDGKSMQRMGAANTQLGKHELQRRLNAFRRDGAPLHNRTCATPLVE